MGGSVRDVVRGERDAEVACGQEEQLRNSVHEQRPWTVFERKIAHEQGTIGSLRGTAALHESGTVSQLNASSTDT